MLTGSTCFGKTVRIFAYGTNTRTFHSRFVSIAKVIVMFDLRSAAILLLAVLVAILVLVVASALYQGRRTSRTSTWRWRMTEAVQIAIQIRIFIEIDILYLQRWGLRL